jgi:hypothetical protein
VSRGSKAAIAARAVAVWLVIMAGESLHGVARVIFIEPLLGRFESRQLAVVTGTALIYGITWLAIGWIGAGGRRTLLAIGFGWLILTLTFEISVGRILGLSWTRIASDYDLRQGGFLLFGFVGMAFAPLATKCLRARQRNTSERIGCRNNS